VTAPTASPVIVVGVDELRDLLREVFREERAGGAVPKDEPALITSSTLCGRLGVSRATVFRWRTKEGMPAVRIGRDDYRFELDRVLEWVRERR
jgi:excisionase family DNA binding protein